MTCGASDVSVWASTPATVARIRSRMASDCSSLAPKSLNINAADPSTNSRLMGSRPSRYAALPK